jgi:enoyl-[acyl-carrier protein] reductase I
MGILEGKRILVAGVTLNTSIAYAVAQLAQREGATVLVSNFGRALSLTRRVVAKLDPVPPVLEIDVTNPEHLAALPDLVREHVDGLDGLVHSVAYANPETALGGHFLDTPWEDVSTALHVSAYSMASLVRAARPVLAAGSSVVGLTFDGTISWPMYDWMGVAKAALESTSRYLARYLGEFDIRSNLVSAGPIDSLAKKAIPGASELDHVWDTRAALGWDTKDPEPTAKAVVALLSDWFPKTTGEVIHVDGGVHSTGA